MACLAVESHVLGRLTPDGGFHLRSIQYFFYHHVLSIRPDLALVYTFLHGQVPLCSRRRRNREGAFTMRRVIIFGLQDYAELAHYLTHDSADEVVAFAVHRKYLPPVDHFLGQWGQVTGCCGGHKAIPSGRRDGRSLVSSPRKSLLWLCWVAYKYLSGSFRRYLWAQPSN